MAYMFGSSLIFVTTKEQSSQDNQGRRRVMSPKGKQL